MKTPSKWHCTATAFVVVFVCGMYPMLYCKCNFTYIPKYTSTSSLGTGVGQECHR